VDRHGSAPVRKLHGVRHQVEENLPQPALVEAQARHSRFDVDVELHSLLSGVAVHHPFEGIESALDLEFLDVQLHLSCFDLRQVEDVVDQGE